MKSEEKTALFELFFYLSVCTFVHLRAKLMKVCPSSTVGSRMAQLKWGELAKDLGFKIERKKKVWLQFLSLHGGCCGSWDPS